MPFPTEDIIEPTEPESREEMEQELAGSDAALIAMLSYGPAADDAEPDADGMLDGRAHFKLLTRASTDEAFMLVTLIFQYALREFGLDGVTEAMRLSGIVVAAKRLKAETNASVAVANAEQRAPRGRHASN